MDCLDFYTPLHLSECLKVANCSRDVNNRLKIFLNYFKYLYALLKRHLSLYILCIHLLKGYVEISNSQTKHAHKTRMQSSWNWTIIYYNLFKQYKFKVLFAGRLE